MLSRLYKTHIIIFTALLTLQHCTRTTESFQVSPTRIYKNQYRARIKLSSTGSLKDVGQELLSTGESIVATATFLIENDAFFEFPEELAIGGDALSNAGKFINVAYDILHDRLDWEEAVSEGLFPAAGQLQVAAASLHYCEEELLNAAEGMLSACEITGCIVMAAAAASDINESASFLSSAGEKAQIYGGRMISGSDGSPVEEQAGNMTIAAGQALSRAASSLKSFGEALAKGIATP
jgi:hypothetical protein